MKYHIKTYGCQMNYSDSERIMTVLELAEYQKTSQENEADLIVINMCSVRKSAVDRIAGNFKKYKKYKEKNPDLKIILTGCVLESDKERFGKLFDAVVDIKNIKQLLNCHSELVSESTKNDSLIDSMSSKLSAIKIGRNSDNKQRILKQVQNDSNNDYFKIKPHYQSKFSAYIPIMTGCNNFCSYCVVPYARGREYSRPAEEVISEIRELVKKGYREIILLGQNVNSYESKITNYEYILSFLRRQESTTTPNVFKCANLNNKSNEINWIPASAGMTGTITFPKLLKLINNIPGDFWIRFLSSHPKDITEELIKTISECEKVTPYIHLALQSGDNEILKKMNRKYTVEHFLNLIKIIRKYIPDATIITDVIVGFPSETEKQFQKTSKVMREAKFDMAYINKYSPRAGTASYKMKDDVSWEEKKRREVFLTKILKETALENNQKYVGKVVEVLVDEIGIKNQELRILYGKTKSFKNVKIETGKNKQYGNTYYHTENLVGKIIKVKITKARVWNLEGEMVE